MNHGIITDKATWGDATRLRWKTWPSKKFPSSFRRETKIECFYLATQRSSHLSIRSKINFLKGKEQSKRSIYRVSRQYRGTLQELYERAVDNWVAEKRGSPSVAPSVYARPETRCVRRCRGRACASLRQPRERVEGVGRGGKGQGRGICRSSLGKKGGTRKANEGPAARPCLRPCNQQPGQQPRYNLLPPRIESYGVALSRSSLAFSFSFQFFWNDPTQRWRWYYFFFFFRATKTLRSSS